MADAGKILGNSKMHDAVRDFDWATTPLGALETWSTSLISMVQSMLSSNFPSVLHWGPQLIDIFNDAYAELVGVENAHLGQSVTDNKETWPHLEALFGKILTTGESAFGKEALFAANRNGYKEESYFTASYSPAYDDGSISGVQLICYEVTDQVISERRLLLLHALAQLPENTRGPLELAKRIGKLCGEHTLDIPIMIILLLDDNNELQLAYETQHVPDLDMKVVGKAVDGIAFDIDVEYRNFIVAPFGEVMQRATIAPMFSRTGKVIGVVCQGVSPARDYDDTYRSFFELLRRQIAIALDNSQQLEKATKRAAAVEQLDRVKTNLFNNMSHEMRTPMNAIVGGSSLLLEAELSEVQRDLVEMINNSAAHLLAIINDVLDFSKLDSDNVEYAADPFDLSLVIDEAISLVGMQAARTGSSVIRIDQGVMPRHVIGDKTRVRQILLNLLSNAAKFTDLGTIEVRTDYNGTCLKLEVSDTGIGIAADKLDTIFDVFSQVDKRVSTGAGIGLSITRSLVKGMKGDISVESTVGVGTTFKIRIPMAATDLAPVAPLVFEANQNFAIKHPLQILIAEDNMVNQKILAALLERLGYSADIVDDGKKAVFAAQTGKYNVILMDVQMPEMDGLEAAREIGALMPPETAPRIIAVTANAKHETDQGAAAAGMVGYITKPVTMGALIGALTGVSEAKDSNEGQRTIDTARLTSLVSYAELPSLVQSYLESNAVLLSQIEAAWNDSNEDRMQKIMRQIQMSSNTIGATELVNVATRYLDDGTFDMVKLTECADRLRKVLARYVPRPSTMS